METSGKIEHAIKRYGTREELAKRGVWRGDLYRAEEARFLDRGWCWKTLLLGDEDELLATELEEVPANPQESEEKTLVAGKLGVRQLTKEVVQDLSLIHI